MKDTVKKAFLTTLPVLTGYLVLGMGFGILLQSKGFGILWSLAMSVCIYAGSMQYLAVDLLAGGASLLSVALTTLMVNARHLFYGLSMVDTYKDMGKAKPYLIFSLTDETYSLVCSRPAGEDKRYYLLVSLFNQIYWVVGCSLGSLAGALLPFQWKGIDFALTALFISVFTEQWLTSKDRTAAVVGVVSALLCLLVFGADRFLIPAMLLITAVLSAVKAFRKEKSR